MDALCHKIGTRFCETNGKPLGPDLQAFLRYVDGKATVRHPIRYYVKIHESDGTFRTGPSDSCVFYAGIFYSLKLFSHFVALSTVWQPFRSLPDLIVALGQDGCRSLAVLPRPLPPDVAKSTIVLPEKSWLSKKVLMIDGAVYHQIGKPR